jgi:hypothetical protein
MLILTVTLAFVCIGFRNEYSSNAYRILPYIGLVYEIVSCLALVYVFMNIPVESKPNLSLFGDFVPWLFAIGMAFMVLWVFPSFRLGQIGTTAFVIAGGTMLLLLVTKYVVSKGDLSPEVLVGEVTLLCGIGVSGFLSHRLFG